MCPLINWLSALGPAFRNKLWSGGVFVLFFVPDDFCCFFPPCSFPFMECGEEDNYMPKKWGDKRATDKKKKWVED